MYYLTPIQSGVNSHSIKVWYYHLSEFTGAVAPIHLHPPQPPPRWYLPLHAPHHNHQDGGVGCAPAFISHSKKCWVVLTQFWVKYGQTRNVGLKM